MLFQVLAITASVIVGSGRTTPSVLPTVPAASSVANRASAEPYDYAAFRNGGVILTTLKDDWQFWLVSWNGGVRQRIKGVLGSDQCFDPVKRRILFDGLSETLSQLDLKTGRVSNLRSLRIQGIAVSPDGKKIAVCQSVRNYYSSLVLFTDGHRKPRVLIKGSYRESLYSPSFSSDGRKLAIAAETAERRSSNVKVVDLATGKISHPFGLKRQNGPVHFGRGRELVVEWYGGPDRDIAIYAGRSLKTLRRLSARNANDRLLEVDSRSGRIIFEYWNDTWNPRDRVFTMDATGRNRRPLLSAKLEVR